MGIADLFYLGEEVERRRIGSRPLRTELDRIGVKYRDYLGGLRVRHRWGSRHVSFQEDDLYWVGTVDEALKRLRAIQWGFGRRGQRAVVARTLSGEG